MVSERAKNIKYSKDAKNKGLAYIKYVKKYETQKKRLGKKIPMEPMLNSEQFYNNFGAAMNEVKAEICRGTYDTVTPSRIAAKMIDVYNVNSYATNKQVNSYFVALENLKGHPAVDEFVKNNEKKLSVKNFRFNKKFNQEFNDLLATVYNSYRDPDTGKVDYKRYENEVWGS